jgi:DNA-binding transcriptional LysR family regulator
MDRLACDRMFVAVMESGSFSAASTRQGVSSGQASKLVARLERDVGAQLLNRTTRALSATELGQAYFERVRAILADLDALDDAVRNRSGEAVGRLRITAPASFGLSELTPVLLDLAELHRGLEIDVSFSDRVVNLVDEGFDAAVRIGTINDTTLIARKLTEARIVLVASPAYIAIHGAPATPNDLKGHSCIIDANFRDPMTWRFRSAGVRQPVHVDVKGRLRLSSAEACLAAAERGLGIARIPYFMARARLAAKTIAPLLPEFEDSPLAIHVVYPPTRHLALKLRVFIDFLAERLGGQPNWGPG